MREINRGTEKKCMDSEREEGVFSSSVEYHTRLSSGGVEDPVVRARLRSQVGLVVLLINRLFRFFSR